MSINSISRIHTINKNYKPVRGLFDLVLFEYPESNPTIMMLHKHLWYCSINYLSKNINIKTITIYSHNPSNYNDITKDTMKKITTHKDTILNIVKNISESTIVLTSGYGFLGLSNIFTTIQPLISIGSMILPKNYFTSKLLKSSSNPVKNERGLCEQIMMNTGLSNNLPYVENNGFVSITSANIMATMKEMLHDNIFDIRPPQELIPYNDPNYWYYPYLDSNTNIISDKNTIFNTSNFAYNDSKIHSHLFKRYDNWNSGLYVKRTDSHEIIPKIIHVIGNPNNWLKLLHEPWDVKIWLPEDLINVVQGDWLKIYQMCNDQLKNIIQSLAILEKYGGIVVQSNVQPIRLPLDDYFRNKVVVGYLDESTGCDLQLDIIGGIAGMHEENFTESIDYDAATRHYDGKNNFFRNIRQQNAQQKKDINKTQIIPEFYRNIRSQLSLDISINNLYNILKNSQFVNILPSYYFHLNDNLPSKLTSLTFCHVPITITIQNYYKRQPLIRNLISAPHDMRLKITSTL